VKHKEHNCQFLHRQATGLAFKLFNYFKREQRMTDLCTVLRNCKNALWCRSWQLSSSRCGNIETSLFRFPGRDKPSVTRLLIWASQ